MKFKKGKFRIDLSEQNVFFTADEHYSHKNIIKYSNRPFSSVEEMNESMIDNHNFTVTNRDITFHLGDFALINNPKIVHEDIINKLNGEHIFLKGSHDYWIKDKNALTLVEVMVDDYHITLCHYCLRTWPRSHFNTWHLYGHSHGGLPAIGKSHDVGVDNNNFYPLSFSGLYDIMKNKDDNFNLIKR
jgi:calcineurin-like phosphoesterase family protein